MRIGPEADKLQKRTRFFAESHRASVQNRVQNCDFFGKSSMGTPQKSQKYHENSCKIHLLQHRKCVVAVRGARSFRSSRPLRLSRALLPQRRAQTCAHRIALIPLIAYVRCIVAPDVARAPYIARGVIVDVGILSSGTKFHSWGKKIRNMKFATKKSPFCPNGIFSQVEKFHNVPQRKWNRGI